LPSPFPPPPFLPLYSPLRIPPNQQQPHQVDEEEGITNVYVDPASVSGLRDLLVEKGLEIRATKLVNVPKLVVDCSDEDFESNMRVIEALEELDDVDSVEHNVNDEEG
jgi:transcriptional/translational regulatory protein YebC/TACO1